MERVLQGVDERARTRQLVLPLPPAAGSEEGDALGAVQVPEARGPVRIPDGRLGLGGMAERERREPLLDGYAIQPVLLSRGVRPGHGARGPRASSVIGSTG